LKTGVPGVPEGWASPLTAAVAFSGFATEPNAKGELVVAPPCPNAGVADPVFPSPPPVPKPPKAVGVLSALVPNKVDCAGADGAVASDAAFCPKTDEALKLNFGVSVLAGSVVAAPRMDRPWLAGFSPSEGVAAGALVAIAFQLDSDEVGAAFPEVLKAKGEVAGASAVAGAAPPNALLDDVPKLKPVVIGFVVEFPKMFV